MTDDKRPSCNCTLYNGGQCYNCLNGAHSICGDGHGSCNRTARPSSAQSVDLERVKAWFYSKPRKQAQAAFTAGDERQIAYMLEDAEAKAVVAMNAAAQSATAPITAEDALVAVTVMRYAMADGHELPPEWMKVLHKLDALVGTADDQAARTEAAPIILVRTNTNATLDEAFLRGGEFHLEQMSATHWWMCLELGQQRVHINLHSKATIKAVMEDDGEVKLLTDANSVSDGPSNTPEKR